MRKNENCGDFVYFLCTSVFLGSFYALQIALFVVQLGSVVQWRAAEGLTPATALRQCVYLCEVVLMRSHLALTVLSWELM